MERKMLEEANGGNAMFAELALAVADDFRGSSVRVSWTGDAAVEFRLKEGNKELVLSPAKVDGAHGVIFLVKNGEALCALSAYEDQVSSRKALDMAHALCVALFGIEPIEEE